MARDNNRKRTPKNRKEGYLDQSPAICVVAYDLTGKPIPDSVAAKVISAVFEITQKERLAISFTRT